MLVDVDDASLGELKKPLLYLSPELAKAIDYVNDQGAKAIGVDILIPDSYSRLAALDRGAAGDATTMGDAVARSGKVVLPEWPVSGQKLRPLVRWQLKAIRDPDPNGLDFGFVNLTEDDDQFVRREQLAVPGEEDLPSCQFGLALLAKAGGGSRGTGNEASCQSGMSSSWLDEEQKLRINFVGPSGTFPLIKLSKLLDDARGARHPRFAARL